MAAAGHVAKGELSFQGMMLFVRHEITSGAEFYASYRSGERDFRHASLHEVPLADVHGEGLQFSSAKLTACGIIGGQYNEVNFDAARLKACYTKLTPRFKDSTFVDAAWTHSAIENVIFESCKFTRVSFYGSTLDSVVFQRCELESVAFTGATIVNTRVIDCDVTAVNLTNTVLVETDVLPFTEAAGVDNKGCTLDWRSINKSLRAGGLRRFLLASGMPEVFVEYAISSAEAVDPNLLFKLMRSTFISYGEPDLAFARLLRDRLKANGVRTFFFHSDAKPGERLFEMMRKGVNEYDRVILVCSKASLNRPGVKNEITETLAREARDGGATYLVPITLDNYIFEWEDPLGYALRDRVVADFRSTDEALVFHEAVVRLLAVLRTD